MEASPGFSQPPPSPKFHPDTEKIKRKLLKDGVFPTPRIVHNIRKKAIQKHDRRQDRLAKRAQSTPFSETQKQAMAEESDFQSLRREYREFNKAVRSRSEKSDGGLMVGVPWERIERVRLREIARGSEGSGGDKLKRESLTELGEMFEERRREELQWVLDDDIELEGIVLESEGSRWDPEKRRTRTEDEAIGFLVKRLGAKEIEWKDWKFSRMMKLSGLQFTEKQLLNILRGLGNDGHWKQAMAVVEWVYHDKERRCWRSRFVYTKLLAVLGNARRPQEALHFFNLMREDFHLYPDMAAYHSIAVTLGQTGLVRELMNIVECMRQKPLKIIKNGRRKNWDPVLEPDLVVYNAVLNACVPSHQWKGVSWVFEQLRKSGLKPNGATYGLAMEVMLQCGKYDLVHDLFRKMKRSREALRAISYKVLVRTFWEEGKIDEAVEAVREMECRGVVGKAGVYYELACCLCNSGRWQEAIMEVEKLRKLPDAKPMEIAFTGMIMSAMEGGHINDCLSIFNQMRGLCAPNIGTINIMLKVFGKNDMFSNAKELFEEVKGTRYISTKCQDGGNTLVPDEYTFGSMLEASASALQWEYFEYVYKEMSLSGYQLDQNKHTSLLVAASRAGKGHLLEHAFDAILESGEVPHPLFFVEMVFQAAIQHQYERAVTIVAAMTHVSFQLSEKQWTDHFVENADRVENHCLQDLLSALEESHVMTEGSFKNLLTSLRSLCESASAVSRDISDLGVSLPGRRTEYLSGGHEEVKTEQTNRLKVTANVASSMHNSTNRTSSDMEGDKPQGETTRRFGNSPCWKDGRNDLDNDASANDMASSESTSLDSVLSSFNSDGSLKEFDEDGPHMPTEDSEPKLPTAHEILKSWKLSRQKDGIYFPFQLGKKQVHVASNLGDCQSADT
ncbi:pentatricopeptide repeat-containing protein At5g67570, chloroplastic [Rhodamnia argentea]|uniref:Pentatricopeptide repeat-containing protein At5g67570, chloroplastic n=1 Tax=Rhodamnia argentea TaxID=178133 RepID=A0A8B8PXH4_9MYRT|nr:pentatricopeptide repeat-containing protein At5g67570, chloroplastic [Rhodamnia argentea]